MIKKLEVPEDYKETVEGEDEDQPSVRNELVYIAGRVYKEDVDQRTKKAHKTPKWIYERYNQVITTQKFPDFQNTLADLQRNADEEVNFYESEIRAAQEKLQVVAEEKKAAALAAAAKKKAAIKKGKKEEPVEQTHEDNKPSANRNFFPD